MDGFSNISIKIQRLLPYSIANAFNFFSGGIKLANELEEVNHEALLYNDNMQWITILDYNIIGNEVFPAEILIKILR